ncbi:hypothetical protein GUJ93_ZPchr0014g47689 [Zizania palustris]|uniref:Uncharacterized protein n=1 Tax=Zizania palustris TaxID=103762 RepID=A0A8J5TKW5_ZIZPA|nr:hypothetical protein GUJ93_ZPchr0014g47689 [Zizania palustris]
MEPTCWLRRWRWGMVAERGDPGDGGGGWGRGGAVGDEAEAICSLLLLQAGAKSEETSHYAVELSLMPNLQIAHHYNVIFAIGIVGVLFWRSPTMPVLCVQNSH